MRNKIISYIINIFLILVILIVAFVCVVEIFYYIWGAKPWMTTISFTNIAHVLIALLIKLILTFVLKKRLFRSTVLIMCFIDTLMGKIMLDMLLLDVYHCGDVNNLIRVTVSVTVYGVITAIYYILLFKYPTATNKNYAVLKEVLAIIVYSLSWLSIMWFSFNVLILNAIDSYYRLGGIIIIIQYIFAALYFVFGVIYLFKKFDSLTKEVLYIITLVNAAKLLSFGLLCGLIAFIINRENVFNPVSLIANATVIILTILQSVMLIKDKKRTEPKPLTE